MPKRVAIIFFGLTRSLKNIYNNLTENLFNELTNNGYNYDIFIHTYSLENPYINPWSGESISNYDNTAYEILNPKYYIIENQNSVEKKLNINSYCSNLSNWKGCANTPEMKRYLVRNMVLALHSKKMITQLFKEHKNEYDYVIITRPDQLLHTKLNTNAFSLLNNRNIIIPCEHSYHGYNDRFCIAKPNVAIKYGTAFYVLKLYSQIGAVVSEVFMKDYLKSLGLKIIFSPIKTQLIRC
jgi:cellulose biosynthesis protein BcsQ